MSAGSAALSAEAFAGLMARLGPIEPQPRIAAAVSGGADSLALAVLLHNWACDRGGQVLALTVDHGLRRESGAEARFVAGALAPLGIAHRVLRSQGGKPEANLQDAARRARYELLAAACSRRRILHLALGHHLDDQAETLLLRLGRGSGLDGLSAMAPVAELAGLRLLRPLLEIPKARLAATLEARGLEWVEDPSNRDPAQARARLRRLMPALAREGLTSGRLAAAAGHLGRARGALDVMAARVLVAAVRLDPAGFARLEPAPLLAAPEETGLRALARLLTTIGGATYGPRLAPLRRVYGALVEGLPRPTTLGGCRVLRHRGGILVVREARGLPELAVRPGVRLRWDGRFDLTVDRKARGSLRVAALGVRGWSALRAAVPGLAETRIPAPARPVLPALFDGAGVLSVPLLGYRRGRAGLKSCRFRPENALSPAAFTVV